TQITYGSVRPEAKLASTWELPEGDVIDPLPIYTPGFENYNDPLTAKYPLQLTRFLYISPDIVATAAHLGT
ncbi:hypothetical protein ACLBVW_38335, partial [Pseudomonas aeruginosa]|uniref:hypothetical protein n=1 Tax=Pseudomonas aeruginosa TaxID=287 RepID=UPI00396A753D